ncbi:MAG: HAMP domain-containing sensor histidine kinase, partial [Bacteroidota bacterium]
MRRHLLAAILLLSLAGLTFIQFRLLVAGLRLEKVRFDYRTMAALQAVRQTLNEPNPVSDSLISLLTFREKPNADTVFVARALDSLLSAELQKRAVTARFAFAITEKNTTLMYLASPGFQPGEFDFGRYALPLGDRLIARCHCERTLHLNAIQLVNYLLGELDYLIIPSVLCLLAILLCLGLILSALRKEQKLNAIKNDFINNLTHELKTPAFSISLSAKMAKENLEKGDPAKALHLLQLIENENKKLKAHVEKVLELASLESPRHNLQKESADLHQLIREVLDEFSPQVESRLGKLTADLRASDFQAQVDKTHFQNALRNLLDNTLKYCPGAPVIEVATASEGRQFRLRVKDNGIGIAPAQQRLIFDKFYRAPSGDVHQVKGFGLGSSY